MKKTLQTNQIKFFPCSNASCNKLFQINTKEVEFGNGIHLCPECLSKTKTHHTIECASCLSIIDFIPLEEGEKAITYYSQQCSCCSGTVDDEVILSKFNSIETFIHS